MNIYKKLNNFIYHNSLIKGNDKILLAVSGGIDSLVMTHFLKQYVDSRKAGIEIHPVYIQLEQVELVESRLNYVRDLFKSIGLSLKVITSKVAANIDFHCFTCARERRKQLCIYAILNKFDSIAFGHILDDYLETGLLNMIFHGNLQSMKPFDTMFDKQIQIIRPLLPFSKKIILKYAHEHNIENKNHKCIYEKNNKRDAIRQFIKAQRKIFPCYEQNLKKVINQWNDLII